MSSNSEHTVTCTDCGYLFQGDELIQDTNIRKPCPNCGSMRRCANFIMKEQINLHEYIHLGAKKQGSKHNGNRVDFELGEGEKTGGDGELVYKKKVIDREHPDLPNSYQEYVRDKDGKILVNKNEKLSEHQTKKSK